MTERFYNEMRRHYYTTPSSYLELLKLYQLMLADKKDKIVKTRDRIANGLRVSKIRLPKAFVFYFIVLKKLYETNEVIDVMKVELTEMEPKLAAKSIAVAELMKHLEKEQTQADKVRNIVKADEEICKVMFSFVRK